MSAFHAAGAEARFIGGCVRDAVLKRPAKDIDIATPEEPERVLEILEDADIRAIPTGLKHGTITAVVGTQHFEITTLRVDVENYGRHAKVAFTDDWTQDAARRDFTINAMSCDEHGNVYDPYEGLEHLGNGWVRFVGEAEQRINEDVLRLLRFFRFYAQYGKPPINLAALRACRKLAYRLPELSGERVRGELFRILMAPNPADTITLMRGEKVLPFILPEAGDVGRLRMLAWLLERAVKFDDIDVDPVRRLAALVKPELTPDELVALSERLKFSNRERKHLIAICAPTPIIHVDMSDKDVRLACAKVGANIVVDRALLSWSGELALEAHLPPARTESWRRLIETARDSHLPAFPLKGRDVLDRGVAHGPDVGRLLKQVEAWWRERDFRPDRTACLNKLSELLEPHP
ncbi:CCA tRNA nucleotidyltransferase [Magnetovibrio sp.]|uniref:CCA tRNA nucleotidyltransferase n=1 Tax=Magnetovibrio sp. TaxID=2024836 RepID=UPI002F94CFDE